MRLSFVQHSAGPAAACLYEFQYVPVLLAFKEAKARGADVKIVVDLKGTTYAPAKRSVISNGPQHGPVRKQSPPVQLYGL